MERFKNLDRYQKVLFVLLCVMVIVFTLVYAVVSARVGFEFYGSILLPRTVGRDTVYSGTVAAEKITITVTAEKSVTFDCGVKVYGPFTVVEDPTAIPPDANRELYTTGIEVRQGDSAYFRGGVAYLNTKAQLKLRGCTIKDNVAKSHSSVIWANGSVLLEELSEADLEDIF